MSVHRWRRDFRKFRAKNVPISRDIPLSFSAFLYGRTQKNRHSANFSGGKETKASAKRYAREIRSKLIKKYRGNRQGIKIVKSPKILLFKNRDDFTRDILCPNYHKRYVDIPSRIRKKSRSQIEIKNFSFARNPRGTLRQIRELVRLAAKDIEVRVNFTDERCDDIAPYIILSSIFRSLPPVFTGGVIHNEVAAVIEAVGLSKLLGIAKIFGKEHLRLPVLPFALAQRRPPAKFGDKLHQLKPQDKEEVADRFCDTLNDWLDAYDLELTLQAQAALSNSITEALDNAERHGLAGQGAQMGDWSIAGFSRLLTEGATQRLQCSFAIVNTGVPIADGMRTASTSVLDRIRRYLGANRATEVERQRLLTTVMALQDGVTRVADASDAGRGGVGLMELIRIFADMGETDNDSLQSVFTILSGRSCLRITSPYRTGIPDDKSLTRELWFNPKNSEASPPDSNHAFVIDENFAGTILTVSFTLDRDYITRKLAA